MRAASLTAAALVIGWLGWAMEVAHPVFFASEPVVAWTSQGEGAPILSFCGTAFDVAWQSSPAGERVRWEASLPPDAPLGIWMLETQDDCYSFWRVPASWALLEIVAVPGTEAGAPGTQAIPVRKGVTDLVGPAGTWTVSITFPGPGEPTILNLDLAPEERRQSVLAKLSLVLSTPVALPGSDVLLTATVLSPVDLPTLNAALQLPPGWDAESISCEACPLQMEEPIPAWVLTTRAWLLHIPPDARGQLTIGVALPDLGLAERANLSVEERLPLEVVVSHWDTQANTLDLTLPPELTYERLLWAASLLGQKVPFTGQVLTRSGLDALAKTWSEYRAP